MPKVSIQFDEATCASIDRLAPASNRKRADFIRQAVKESIRRREYERIREGYLRLPDTTAETCYWSAAE